MKSRIVICPLKEVTNLRVLMCYIDNSLLNYYRQQAKSHRANQSLNRFPIKAVADRLGVQDWSQFCLRCIYAWSLSQVELSVHIGHMYAFYM